MTIVSQLVSAVAPWASFYSDNSLAQSLVAFGHFGGMMVAGGFALAADRASLRLDRSLAGERARHLEDLSGTHRIVIGALAVTTVSGLLMFAADVENLIPSPAFWIKMGLLALLLGNGWIMTRLERRLRAQPDLVSGSWGRLRASAAISLVLWFAVVLAGTMLTNQA
jgi:hypothetical protein